MTHTGTYVNYRCEYYHAVFQRCRFDNIRENRVLFSCICCNTAVTLRIKITNTGLRNRSMQVTQFRVGTHFKTLFGRLGAKNGYSLAVLHKTGSGCARVCVGGEAKQFLRHRRLHHHKSSQCYDHKPLQHIFPNFLVTVIRDFHPQTCLLQLANNATHRVVCFDIRLTSQRLKFKFYVAL